MTTPPADPKPTERDTLEGWAWPLNSKKAHYFVGARSLCGAWMFLGSNLENDKHDSPDNCKACTKKRDARAIRARGES